jgi:hypothetical protein
MVSRIPFPIKTDFDFICFKESIWLPLEIDKRTGPAPP